MDFFCSSEIVFIYIVDLQCCINYKRSKNVVVEKCVIQHNVPMMCIFYCVLFVLSVVLQSQNLTENEFEILLFAVFCVSSEFAPDSVGEE